MVRVKGYSRRNPFTHELDWVQSHLRHWPKPPRRPRRYARKEDAHKEDHAKESDA